jgi:hypothetical protein
MGFEHVHCWFVRDASGGWLLVDTAIAAPGVEPLWESALAGVDGPVEKILVTHFHPDHVGGAALVAELTGAPVYQGRSDFDDCRIAWADPGAADRLAVLLERHGFPAELGEKARAVRRRVFSQVGFHPDPILVDLGDEIDGGGSTISPATHPAISPSSGAASLRPATSCWPGSRRASRWICCRAPTPSATTSPRSNGWSSSAPRSCFPVTRT